MVIRLRKFHIVIFIVVLLLTIGGLFYFKGIKGKNISRGLNNKSSYYKEVGLEQVVDISDEELETIVFSIVDKLNLDLGEPMEAANIENPYGDNYNYDFIFSNGNIQLDEKTGELREIAISSYKSEGEDLLDEELIDRACEYYNILECPINYEIRNAKSLGNDYYNVVWEKQYDNNLYSQYESVNMVLNKKDGSLNKISINNIPNISEENLSTLKKEEAEKAITSFKGLKGYSYNGQIEKQIVVPNTTYLSEDYEYANYCKVAWVAKLNNGEGKEAYIYIDTADGKILGGK